MIGILIAVQINAISQRKKLSKLEKVILNQVKFELLETYEDIWRDAGNLNQGVKSHKNVLTSINQDRPYSDSLCFDFHWIQVDEYIYLTTAGYGRLKEMGLDIIKNDEIRILLQSLYEGHFPHLRKHNSFTPDITQTFHEYYLNEFRPNYDTTLLFDFHLQDDTVGNRIYANVYYQFPKRNGQTISYVPLNFEELKADPKFHMLLDKTNQYRNNRAGHYASVKSIIKDVIQLINSELQ